jgi:hypothetical protein
MMAPTEWVSKGEGKWRNDHGATINLVNPRGKKLYARLNDGDQRPRWYDSLREARKDKADKE